MLKFLDRRDELARLDDLAGSRDGGLAVVHGRRRLGKTRLLLEWCARHDGLYSVADQSTPDVQRRYLAEAIAGRLPGFADVEYRDWGTLLARLAREARAARWRGPVVLDELPYLVGGTPELPSVLQRFVDHEAREARLVLAIAGSSQRMMQGIVLSADAPLYGRARAVLDVRPLPAAELGAAFPHATPVDLVEHWTAWGGVPRYWELAADATGTVADRVVKLVLDPLGPLHDEPNRLLIEEMPPATEVRPLLDAIGAGAHRVSEIAGRIGRPATSLSRPLERLLRLGLIARETPFGEPPRQTRRSLYRIQDPLFRLWFRVVAPHRAGLAAGTPQARRQLLARFWEGLVAAAWEDLCRRCVARLSVRGEAGGPWAPASRWWRGNAPEWDIVAVGLDARRLLLGEARWHRRPMTAAALRRAAAELAGRAAPSVGDRAASDEVRVLFVPRLERGVRRRVGAVHVVTATEVLSAA